jgi:toxin ParE1/3/4
MAEITWSIAAENDLKNIYDYISVDSEFYADKVVDEIYKSALVLETHIRIGKVVPEFGHQSIRELIEGRYRIIYKIENEHKISIVRIYHSARLLKSL